MDRVASDVRTVRQNETGTVKRANNPYRHRSNTFNLQGIVVVVVGGGFVVDVVLVLVGEGWLVEVVELTIG
jgi:hypothetical protein